MLSSDYCIPGFCPSHRIQNRTRRFGNWMCPKAKCGETPIHLVGLEEANPISENGNKYNFRMSFYVRNTKDVQSS